MSILEIILLSYLLFIQIVMIFSYFNIDKKSKAAQATVFILVIVCFLPLSLMAGIKYLFKKIVERKHLKNQVQEDIKKKETKEEEKND